MPYIGSNNRGTSVGSSGSNLYISSGTVVKPTIIYNTGLGTIAVGQGKFRFYHDSDYTGVITEHTILEITLPIIDNITNYLVAKYNNGNPQYEIILDLSLIDWSSIMPVYTIARIGDNISVIDWDEPGLGATNKNLRRITETRRFERINGFDLAEIETRNVKITTGKAWQGFYRGELPEVISSIDTTYLWINNGNGTFSHSVITQYPNDKYDPGTGTLATLTDGKYAVIWVYRCMCRSDILSARIHLFLCDEDASLDQAKYCSTPDIPQVIATNAMLVGRIIVLKGTNTAIQIDNAFATLFAPSAVANSGVVIGSVQMFAGLIAPSGYHLCDGSTISRTTYASLFNIIGTTYGVGNGSTTFNLPNFKGRVPVGYDATQIEFDSIGETGGAKTHQITTSEMPSHTHTFTGNALPSHAHNYTRDGYNDQEVASNTVLGDDEYVADNETDTTNNTSSVSAGTPSGTNSSEGGNTAFNIMNPYITLLYIIKY